MNLFSGFDPMSSVLNMKLNWNWVVCCVLPICVPVQYWLSISQPMYIYSSMISFLENELKAVFGKTNYLGVIFLFLAFFFIILFSNIMGLLPYVFTSTSHPSMTLTLALPLWLGSILFSITWQYNTMLTHLVPVGTPGLLMPVMVIIESISNLIRPGTLTIRLTANMVAGHLLLSLLGGAGETSSGMILFFVIGSLVLLVVLECAVACIQAYVFCVLSSLYLNELMSISFNKKMTYMF